jgi:hypothetical protein
MRSTPERPPRSGRFRSSDWRRMNLHGSGLVQRAVSHR